MQNLNDSPSPLSRLISDDNLTILENIIQAFYFGMIHLNLVQGIYAFLLGIVLGAVVKRYGTLKASMYLHFVINFSGQLLSLL